MILNKVSLIGYLESDPTSRTLPSGKKIAAITLITAEDTSLRAADEEVLTAVPHDVVAHGKLAGIILKHLKTGDRLYIEGRLEGALPNEQGKRDSKTQIVATQLILLGGKSKARQSQKQRD